MSEELTSKKTFKYFAFISYSHADKKIAKKLQRKLEHYHLPITLRKNYPELPKNLSPIFVDDSDLVAKGTLKTALQDNLERANYLIVICSPNSAKSEYVNDEVEYFIKLGRQDHIIPFIVDGAPHSQDNSLECFPPALFELPRENEEGEEEEDINENKEEKNFGENKDIFFSMKDLNNFADQFEEEDNENDNDINDTSNKIKSAPNKLTLTTSRNKNKKNSLESNEEEEEEDENNSLYSEEQEIKAEIDSDEEIKFDKFFDKPKNNKLKSSQINDNDSSSLSDIDENEIFTQIKKIEEKMISNKKDWSTKGEVLGKERPKDSLLTKSMDFEVGLKAPPIPDREFTDKLESIIKQRILDDLFDDPIKKDIINLNEQKKAENDLDFEKSKKGLGEIYEDKYLGNEKTETKIDEIKKDCDILCNKLFDIFKQMTNGTATPYDIQGKKEELNSINITNIPAIQIEDIGNFISDNTSKIKSGKEMFNIKKTRNKNKEEMTPEELRNLHNRKKRNIKSRIHKKENKKKLENLTQMLGSKFEAKIKMKQERNKRLEKMDKSQGKEFKSGKFFGKINEMAVKDEEKKIKNNKISE